MSAGQLVRIGAVEVRVAPGLTLDFAQLPDRSIALDGVVQGPAVDTDRHRFSFDHHGDCLRLVTAATCQQVADAILLGLEPARHTAYVNDLDADTALSVALLAHPHWLAGHTSTSVAVRRLVASVAGRDAHGPAYPVMDPELLAAFRARVPLPAPVVGAAAGAPSPATGPATGGGAWLAVHLSRAVAAIAGLVDDLSRLIDAATAEETGAPTPTVVLLGGAARALADPAGSPAPGDPRPQTHFEITRTGTGWVLVTSDADALDQVYAAGYSRVVMWRRLPDGSTAYSVARRSDLVDGFPVGPVSRPGTILAALAAREPGWGGGSSIGGAPRHPDGRRSALAPDEVFAIVEATVLRSPPPS
ncbi:hypothetical protein ND748_19365 [Frankia sp. AiPs1]|nr:hypothetical protein [Frankia sp. AiPs1]